MKRIHVICEGPTEINFVREVLQIQFSQLHLIPILPGKTFGKGRGGDIKYDRVKPDIVRVLKHDRECCCTTFFDYYGLGDFPEKEEPRGQEPEEKAQRIELAMADDITKTLGTDFNPARFYPYLSLYEFEGLLFSDPQQLAQGLYHPDLQPDLTDVRQAFSSPEHINDDPETAPSKRLKRICPGYDKVTGGNIAALSVGLDAMRQECSHFRRWLEWFESFTRL